MIPTWLAWARELQAAAQNGLTYAANPYEVERYRNLQDLAVRMMSEGSGEPAALIEGAFAQQKGYATPKVDVRAAIFREREVLLVSETIDGGRWTMPGGFADPNETPSQSVVREVCEEAGYQTVVKKLCAVFDRDKHGGTSPYPFHIYKLFFLCEIEGPCQKSDLETGEPRWFPIDALPEMSLDRTQPWHVQRLYEHFRNPALPAEFD